jgi:hypothetical protein
MVMCYYHTVFFSEGTMPLRKNIPEGKYPFGTLSLRDVAPLGRCPSGALSQSGKVLKASKGELKWLKRV